MCFFHFYFIKKGATGVLDKSFLSRFSSDKDEGLSNKGFCNILWIFEGITQISALIEFLRFFKVSNGFVHVR